MRRRLLPALLAARQLGNDWPHVHRYGAMPYDGDMLGLLAGWADAPTRELILRDNPAALYGF